MRLPHSPEPLLSFFDPSVVHFSLFCLHDGCVLNRAIGAAVLAWTLALEESDEAWRWGGRMSSRWQAEFGFIGAVYYWDCLVPFPLLVVNGVGEARQAFTNLPKLKGV